MLKIQTVIVGTVGGVEYYFLLQGIVEQRVEL